MCHSKEAAQVAQGVARIHTAVAEGVGPMSKSHTTMSRPIEFLPKPLFSVGGAAAYLGVSASTVRRRIAAGALRAQRWGRSWIMWRADLDWYYAGVTGSDGRPLD